MNSKIITDFKEMFVNFNNVHEIIKKSNGVKIKVKTKNTGEQK